MQPPTRATRPHPPRPSPQTHAVNFWGHAYLTLLLLGRLVQAGPSRIVQVVSARRPAGGRYIQ
jgi:NAD(P)-dependent dehydrogenase (short-subunit alcohol dehydrogenase family)